MQKHICVILSGAKNPFPSSFCVTERYKDGGCGFFGLWPQNDGERCVALFCGARRRRRKLRIPHPAASGRLRPLRCSGSPSERRSAFRWVPHSASLGSHGAPVLRPPAQLPLDGGAVRLRRTEGVNRRDLPSAVILSEAKNPFPPPLCVTGVLPQRGSQRARRVVAPHKIGWRRAAGGRRPPLRSIRRKGGAGAAFGRPPNPLSHTSSPAWI